MTLIAGHLFRETIHGRACGCGVRWVDIAAVQREHIGRLGWAHTGALLEGEYDEIRAEVERFWALVTL